MVQDVDTLVERAESEWFGLYTAGPTNTRWEELPPQVGDTAPDLELVTQDGASVHLSDFWDDAPALVLFWRHFGCGCGFERAEQLGDECDSYVEAGANVVIVSEGEPARASAYAAEHDIECPVLCDPDREAYTAYGLGDLLLPEVLHGASDALFELDADAAEELAAERRAKGQPLVDNPWQQPGEFVVDSDGTLRLTYRYQYCEDYSDPNVLRSAIRQARAWNERGDR